MKRRELASEAAWGIGDQAFSSLTNFALSILVARNVSTRAFGAFTLAFAAYTIVLTITRALTSELLTIRYSTAAYHDWRAATAASTGTSLVVGLVAGVLTAGIGLLVGDTTGHVLIVLGLTFPGLLLQDAWRYAFFALHRGRSAMMNDLVWALALFVVFGFLIIVGFTVVQAVLVWSLSASVAAVFGIWQAHTFPDPRKPLHWWRQHWDLIPNLTAESIVLSGAVPLSLFAIGGVAGLAAAGAVRAGQVLMNAINVVTNGLRLTSVPAAAKLARRSTRTMMLYCIVLGGGLAALTLVWTALLMALPSGWGEKLLGETWGEAEQIILPVGIATALKAWQSGANVGLRALAVTSRSLKARILSATAVVVGGTIGAVISGPVGAAWGLALGSVVGGISWWHQLYRAYATVPQGSAVTPDGPTEGSPVPPLSPMP